jgi:hypothetical protein
MIHNTVHSESHWAVIKVAGSDVHAVTLYGKRFSFSQTALCAVASPDIFLLHQLVQWFWWTPKQESEMSINFLSLNLDGLPLCSASNTEPVSQNFAISLRTTLWWGTGVCGNVSANCSCTKSVYLLPSQKTYSTRKTQSSIERTIVSKNWIKQLHTLLVLHFNRCLTTEYSETTAHFNGDFSTDNHIYVP